MREGNMPVARVRPRVFVASVDESLIPKAAEVAKSLRDAGIDVTMNVTDRFISKQMELANSLGIRYVVIVGSEEIKSKRYKLRDMKTKEQTEKTLEQIAESLA